MSVRLEPWESDEGAGNELANLEEHSGLSASFRDRTYHCLARGPKPKCAAAGNLSADRKIQTI